jgi:hypothetical protein
LKVYPKIIRKETDIEILKNVLKKIWGINYLKKSQIIVTLQTTQGFYLIIVDYRVQQVMHKIDLTNNFCFIPVYSYLIPLNNNQFFMMDKGMSCYFLVTIKPFNVIKINHKTEYNLE